MDKGKSRTSKTLKVALIVCGSIALVEAVLIIAFVVWFFSGPYSGVKFANEMDRYALDYLAEKRILEAGEELVAYYDATVEMNGTEAAILTTKRVVYHKGGRTTSIPIEEIADIRLGDDEFAGDIIEIQAQSGQAMKIEIAPHNRGETFVNALSFVWWTAVTDIDDD